MFDEKLQQHTHWLHGRGPDNIVKLNVVVETETQCMTCAHKNVCNFAMPKRCVNFESGGSSNYPNTCDSCIKKYTRYDNKDPIPCFKCNDYMSAP